MDAADLLDFSDRAILVTGGTRGIGAGIAARFRAAGATVVVCGRTPPAEPDGCFVAADVRDPEQVRRLVEVVTDRCGRLDVVVNNAGGSPAVAAASASPRLSAKVVELNLLAPLLVAQQAYAVMRDQPGGGSIIMIGSVAALRPAPGTAAYAAAKAGLHHLATSLAVEWAPLVRVNTVVAGLVEPDRGAGSLAAGSPPELPAGSPPEHPAGGANPHYPDLAAVAATVPMGRMATPLDIADACLFLASPLARYVTGAALTVHGGGEWPAYLAGRRDSA